MTRNVVEENWYPILKKKENLFIYVMKDIAHRGCKGFRLSFYVCTRS